MNTHRPVSKKHWIDFTERTWKQKKYCIGLHGMRWGSGILRREKNNRYPQRSLTLQPAIDTVYIYDGARKTVYSHFCHYPPHPGGEFAHTIKEEYHCTCKRHRKRWRFRFFSPSALPFFRGDVNGGH